SGNRPAGIPNISQLGLFIDQIAKYINIRPIVIDISQDGQTWQTIATITQAKRAGEPLILTLEPPAQARHVRIKCQKNVLGFDEIEIY
ncbi:MAG TPA: discoidin domain-containing protein, partial [Candidatus Omnitrophota bacterium]|nr:discoidin domain-containing protein [Candidatus Omnitrophota bacterium]